MKRGKTVFLTCCLSTLLLLSLAGCSWGSSGGNTSETTDEREPQTASQTEPDFPQTIGPDTTESGTEVIPDTEVPDTVESRLGAMTLEEKIGQMVIIGLDGYEMDEAARSMINDRKVGGFILFRSNVKSSGQLLNLVNSLKGENVGNSAPLFISVDEEGGRISRMPDEINKLPSAKEAGGINSPEFSYRLGGLLADEIKAFGFNMDFAPVLDILSNPENKVIGDRAFGSNPDIVTNLGIQTMNGIRDGGVIPVVKHFPGHGDTAADSHKELPVVRRNEESLSGFELVPFQAAIDHNTDAVMAAHIMLEKIDGEYPATLSEKVIGGLLRDKMGFHGVVITDDMTMGAIVNNFDMGKAAVRSIKAGCDIVLVCHGDDNRTAVLDALMKAVVDGVLEEQRIDDSVYRILRLKKLYGLSDDLIESVDIGKINGRIGDVVGIK